MRRSSNVARTVALGIIADDIFGALMNATSSRHDAILPAWTIVGPPRRDADGNAPCGVRRQPSG